MVLEEGRSVNENHNKVKNLLKRGPFYVWEKLRGRKLGGPTENLDPDENVLGFLARKVRRPRGAATIGGGESEPLKRGVGVGEASRRRTAILR